MGSTRRLGELYAVASRAIMWPDEAWLGATLHLHSVSVHINSFPVPKMDLAWWAGSGQA